MVKQVAESHHCMAVVIFEWDLSRVLGAVDILSHQEVRSEHGAEDRGGGGEDKMKGEAALDLQSSV